MNELLYFCAGMLIGIVVCICVALARSQWPTHRRRRERRPIPLQRVTDLQSTFKR